MNYMNNLNKWLDQGRGYGIGAKSYYNGLPVEGDSGRLFSWAQNMADKDNENERFNSLLAMLGGGSRGENPFTARVMEMQKTPFGEQPNRDMVINYLGRLLK